MNIDTLNATLIYRDDVTDGSSVIRVSRDDGSVPDFEPGQFITIGVPRLDAPAPGGGGSQAPPDAAPGRPRLIRRAYSIASSPTVRDYLELYVVLVKEGRLTPRVWDMHPGDRLWMDDRAKGGFTLTEIPPDRDLIMVSTGTGLAPYMSMLRTYRGRSRWNRFVVIHGVRVAEDLGYRRELERISAEDLSVVYIPAVTREPQASAWRGVRGRVQGVLGDPAVYRRQVGGPLDPGRCHVFLCGNPEMIKTVTAMLGPRGFVTQARGRPGNIHFERYW